MILGSLWQALENSGVGTYIAASEWAFPTLETIHVIAIVSVVGTIAVMDFRLLGLTSRDCAVTTMSRDTLPWTWGAFGLALITGLLLFISKATSYVINPYFWAKMIFMFGAAVNMAVFHGFTWRTVSQWDMDCPVPTGGKMAGLLSLLLWVAVVFCGRVIGFTLGIYHN